MQVRDMTMGVLVESFIEDCLKVSFSTWTQSTHLYEVFEAYCNSNDASVPGNVQAFGMEISKHLQKRKSNGKSIYNVVFKPEIFYAIGHHGLENENDKQGSEVSTSPTSE